MVKVGYSFRRLKSDSLLEIIIAAVLIVVIFGIALMVFSNVLRASFPVKKVKADAVLRRLAEETKKVGGSGGSDTTVGGFKILRSWKSADGTDALHVQLWALDGRADTVAFFDQLMISDEK